MNGRGDLKEIQKRERKIMEDLGLHEEENQSSEGTGFVGEGARLPVRIKEEEGDFYLLVSHDPNRRVGSLARITTEIREKVGPHLELKELRTITRREDGETLGKEIRAKYKIMSPVAPTLKELNEAVNRLRGEKKWRGTED